MSSASVATVEQVRNLTPVTAPPEQRSLVQALARQLESFAYPTEEAGCITSRGRNPVAPKCRIIGPDGTTTEIPEAIFFVLERVAEVMARGDSVTVVPVGQELTTQQAADILNISRQYLVRLLDAGQLAFRRTGKHRRLRIEDVLAFQRQRDEQRRAGLRALTELTEEVGGYDLENTP